MQFLFYREIPALCRGDAAGSAWRTPPAPFPSDMHRDSRRVHALMVLVRETAVDAFTHTHQITMEKITLNAQLDDARLVKPNA